MRRNGKRVIGIGLAMDRELRLFFLFPRELLRQRNKQRFCVRYNVPVMDNNIYSL